MSKRKRWDLAWVVITDVPHRRDRGQGVPEAAAWMRGIDLIVDPTVPKGMVYMLNTDYMWPKPYEWKSQHVVISREAYRMLVREPWDFPNRNPMPHLILFPRIERVRAWIEEARNRIRLAREVLRNGCLDREDW